MKSKLEILFVEDSDTDFELIIRAVEKEGIAFNYERIYALEKLGPLLKRKSFDLIISDYHLPGFTAVEVIAACQKLEVTIPIILVSSNIGETKAVDALKMGATDYLLKDQLSKLPLVINRAIKEFNDKKLKKEAQKQLIERELRLRNLLNSMKDGLVQVDENRNIQYANPAFCEMVNHSLKELINKNINTLIRKEYQNEFNTFVHFNGKTEHICEASLDKNLSTNHLSVILFKDRTAEIKHKNQLTRLNQEMDTLLYRLAHDLRGPICSLEGLIDVLKPTPSSEWQALSKDQIAQSYALLDRLGAIVNVKRAKIKPARIELVPFFDTLIKEGNLPSDSFELILETNYLISDELLLKQALLPLFDNAVKYVNEILKIVITVKENRFNKQIIIKDFGMGIAKKHLKKVTEMFFRGNTNIPGLGLGLYISKFIIEKLNGTIILTSSKNNWTTITLTLPK